MKRAIVLLAAVALSACSLAPTQPSKAIYDLGPAPAATAPGGPLAWRIADVTASPTLATEGMAYRLAFQQAQRLEHYRDSLWAAPPAALLTQRLRQQLAATPGCAGRPPALLAVHLDEFEQVFDGPASSRVVLRVHATLARAGGAMQQAWRIEQAAPTPDAAGAAQGLRRAVDELLMPLSGWLATVPCR